MQALRLSLFTRDSGLDADSSIRLDKGKDVTLELNGYILSGESSANRNVFDVRSTMAFVVYLNN